MARRKARMTRFILNFWLEVFQTLRTGIDGEEMSGIGGMCADGNTMVVRAHVGAQLLPYPPYIICIGPPHLASTRRAHSTARSRAPGED